MLNEISILREIDHPNIVKIYEYFEDSHRFYIITDHVQGGELFTEIINRGRFNESDASIILK
jgi:calcium-dependent protein kinase